MSAVSNCETGWADSQAEAERLEAVLALCDRWMGMANQGNISPALVASASWRLNLRVRQRRSAIGFRVLEVRARARIGRHDPFAPDTLTSHKNILVFPR